MNDKARQSALTKARGLEKAGQLEAALQLYQEAGAVDDAARVLGGLRRPREAGQLLLESLGVEPAQVGQLDAAAKKRALMAAIFFGRAGENPVAVQLFLALGEQARAVELLQRAGDAVGAARLASMKPGELEAAPLLSPRRAPAGGQAVSSVAAQRLEEQGKLELALEAYVQVRRFADAARVAKALHRAEDAAALYADAGLPFEAAGCWVEAGDAAKALEQLCRVPRDDARYRTAAAWAVRLAARLNTIDFKLEHFLTAYLKAGVQGDEDVAVFTLLADLYLAQGAPGNAREALQKVVAARPADAGARERLARLEAQLRPDSALAQQVLEHADLHRPRAFAPLPDLGELPDVSGPPPAPAPRTDAPTIIGGGVPNSPEVGAPDFGRYRLEARIGKGGMAEVFRAWDLELEERVALKVFAVQQTSDVAVARFKQELKLSRQLVHPNLVRLYDIGMHQGRRYISMELLTGATLKKHLLKPMDLREGLGYLIQACHGLQAAHDAGVVHRDVKPDNFFVTGDGVLKVMDFGIAKQHAAPGVTVAGTIAGTPYYMSPEQVASFSSVTHLTDLYALGVCAYEMFTGKVPFNHPELVPLLMMHANTPPAPPRTLNPGIPPALEALILRLLEKDPARRVQSCRELAGQLGAIRDGLPA